MLSSTKLVKTKREKYAKLCLILVSIAIQWRILTQKNTQTDYKCWEKFLEICFSRSFMISKPKDKTDYNFLRGAKFPKARGGQIS